MQKTKKEISIIKEGCKISDRIFSSCLKNINNFKTELDMATYLKEEVKKLKLRESFPAIVAIGKNAAEPHHIPNKTKLTKGFCVIDFGIRYKGYCTDTTRTIYFGKPNKKEKELYNLVLKTQQEGIRNSTPKNTYSYLDIQSRKTIRYSKNFIHLLGHGVGKRIHESPLMRRTNHRKLRVNEVITIEPGLYFKNKLGIRIEDMVLVRDKPIILTKVKKFRP